METMVKSDDEAELFLIHRIDTFREQGKLTDLRIETKDGKCVNAHQLVLAARFPLFLKALTNKQDGVTTKWKRFSADIVEAVVEYAYTGRITIGAGNATRLYLLAHNLGSERIVSWCVEFIRTRISLENVAEVWSVANATLNRELMGMCIPMVAEHFEDVCLRKGLLMQTTAQHFEMLLESDRLKCVSEETKFRAIRKWLEAGIDGCDVKEKAKVFGKMISRIELTRLFPQCQSEYWTFVRRFSEQFSKVNAPPKLVMRRKEIRVRRRIRPVSNCRPQRKEVLMIIGRNTVSKSRCLTCVPQLQPDESFNFEVPFIGEATALGGRVCFVRCVDSRWSVESVNYRDGSTSHETFQTTQRRVGSAVVSRNESIFIFGGGSGKTLFSTCEKLDMASGRLTKLPDMLPARCGASALNIPEIGIVVVGGYQINRKMMKLRHAAILVEDAENGSGWRWIKLNPMLQERSSPAVAYFKGCVVVVGGTRELSAECLPLTSIEQANAQWTRLNGIPMSGFYGRSLVSFNNRLILLLSNFSTCKVHEFLPTKENQPLANFEWKPLFELEDFSDSILLMARETLEER